ncbi:MAG: DUF488 family protein [Pyrobaculum sp.]
MEVYTVGYVEYAVGELVDLLKSRGVEVVVDVRRFPRSRLPGFSSSDLEKRLGEAGIVYIWMGELGALGARGPRAGCVDSPTFDKYIWRLYHYWPAVAQLEELKKIAASRKTVVLCREGDWRRCHRQFIADALAASGAKVVHLSKRGEELHVARDCPRHSPPPPALAERVARDFAEFCKRGSVYLFGGALEGGRDVDVVIYGVGKREELPSGYDAQFIPRVEETLFHYFVTYWGVLICGKPHVVDFKKALKREVQAAGERFRIYTNSDDSAAVCKSAKELIFTAAAVKCGDSVYTWRRASQCLGGAPQVFKNCVDPPPAYELKKYRHYVERLVYSLNSEI